MSTPPPQGKCQINYFNSTPPEVNVRSTTSASSRSDIYLRGCGLARTLTDLMGGQHNNGYPASHSHCLPDHLIIEGEADIQLTEVSPGTLHMSGLPQLHSDRSCT